MERVIYKVYKDDVLLGVCPVSVVEQGVALSEWQQEEEMDYLHTEVKGRYPTANRWCRA